MTKTQRPAEPPEPKRTTAAVILCPGPSLADVPQDLTADIVIGVNRACEFRECTWRVALDPNRFNDLPLGNPRLFTLATTVLWLKAEGKPIPADVLTIDDIWRDYPQCGWNIYSATSALILAAHVGATSIDVYGADWKPDAPDFDNVQTSTNRTVARFESERQIWEATVEYLASRGVTVRRIVP
jgi:hypothetical protein